MLQVPIEILILDEENKDHLNKAIGILHKIQNTFKYSILKNIELEHITSSFERFLGMTV